MNSSSDLQADAPNKKGANRLKTAENKDDGTQNELKVIKSQAHQSGPLDASGLQVVSSPMITY